MKCAHRFQMGIGMGLSACILAALQVAFLVTGARADVGNQIMIGVHAGPGIPSIEGGTNEQSRGYTSRFGPYFGFFAEFPVGPKLSLCTEINYASQGGKRNGMQPIPPDQLPPGVQIPPGMTLYADFHNEAILNYAEIPVMIRMTWGDRSHFFVAAGPYVGFLIRAKTVTSGTSLLYIDPSGTPLEVGDPLPLVSFDGDTNIRDDINSTCFGLAGGVGVETHLGPGQIVLDARFSLGLTNIQSNPEVDGENQTGAVEITIGYAFGF